MNQQRKDPPDTGEPGPSSGAVTKVPVVAPVVSARMSKQRRRDTVPEMLLRKSLFARGLRYRVDASLPGMARRRADVLFTRRHVAVFVDGCFWHCCPVHGTLPRSNHDWWVAKLERNVARDRETDAHLLALGWVVLRFWEHEDMEAAAEIIAQTLRSDDF